MLANACEGSTADTSADAARSGLLDTLRLGQAAAEALPNGSRSEAAVLLAEIGDQLVGAQPLESLLPALARLAEKAGIAAEGILSAGAGKDDASDLVFWIDALRATITGHARDLAADDVAREDLAARMTVLPATAREMALAMDFAFLLDPDRKLLSIGYSVADNRLDSNATICSPPKRGWPA